MLLLPVISLICLICFIGGIAYLVYVKLKERELIASVTPLSRGGVGNTMPFNSLFRFGWRLRKRKIW